MLNMRVGIKTGTRIK